MKNTTLASGKRRRGPHVWRRYCHRQLRYEALETRTLLAVTIDNGLPIDDPGYFSATIEPGGVTYETSYAGNGTVYEYSAYLDLQGDLFRLESTGTEPVLTNSKSCVTST